MKFRNYIFFYFIFISFFSFSQPLFTNLDSLFYKNFEAVNKRDSNNYLSLINQTSIFKSKKAKSRNDSILILQPFSMAFNNLIQSLADMASDSNFVVLYSNYELIKPKKDTINANGKISVRVNLIINNAISVKMPFLIHSINNRFYIDTPMLVMFEESKE